MSNNATGLSWEDARHLEEAEGWLGLGLWADALLAASGISEKGQESPSVLCLKSRAYADGQDWEHAEMACRLLTRAAPDYYSGWRRMAFAIWHQGRAGEAESLLLGLTNLFPGEPDLWWHLAVFADVEGDPELCRKWVRKALSVTPRSMRNKLARDYPEFRKLCKKVKAGKA